MEVLGVTVFFIAIIFWVAITRGFCLTYLWAWFIQPLSESIPDLSIVHAIGLSLIVGFLTQQHQQSSNVEKKTRTEIVSGLIGHSLAPFVVLFLGWVITLFM